ncbi:phage tail tube protein [Spirosoma sp. 209]|uniref:phage tail tube protein n=1 Tax=Spirosoma sp. 209 TaxID=1955701 RepID=UPI00098D2F49|nr:phage tail tube protein [Spirosoma sp. 209]
MAFNGTLLRLKMKPTGAPAFLLVAEETKTNLDLSKDTFETTNKDSGAWRSRISSFKSGEIQCEAYINYTATSGHLTYAQLWAMFNGNVSVDCEFSTDAVGDFSLTGKFHVTKLTNDAPTEQGATVSFTLLSDGTLAGAAESA